MILVTGGTGFVGGYLVPRLLAAGLPVRCMARRPDDLARLRRMGVDARRGDILSDDGLDGVFAGVTTVINMVTVIREASPVTFRAINFEGTLRLLRAAERAGVRRFVHTSVLGCREDPSQPYVHFKWLMERELERSPIEHTILRTSLVFGRGDQSLSFLAMVAKWLPWVHPVPGDGRTQYHPIWVEDYVTCLVAAAVRGVAVGRALDLGGGARYSYDELIGVILRKTGARARPVHVPRGVLWPVAKLVELTLANPPVTAEFLRLLAIDSVAPVDAVERNFGFRPASFEEQGDYLAEVGLANLRSWRRGGPLEQ